MSTSRFRSATRAARLAPAELRPQDGAGVLEEQPHVGRHLVVAAAGRVELRRRRHPPGERVLDVHVDVLEPRVPAKRPASISRQIASSPAWIALHSLGVIRPDVRQHRRMGLAAGDVERRQPAVKRGRLAESQHQLGGSRLEAPAPGGLGFLGHGSRVRPTRPAVQRERLAPPPPLTGSHLPRCGYSPSSAHGFDPRTDRFCSRDSGAAPPGRRPVAGAV